MDFRYSLYGVLVHAGWNTQSGRYYCFVQTSSGNWHNLDDNQVRQVREADVLRQKAYMLFYVRGRVRSSVMFKDNGAIDIIEKKAISGKMACMNDTIRNGLMEATLNVSPFINGDVKSQKQNTDNGHPSIFGNSSQDQCPRNPSSTEVMEAAAAQNNGMLSVQKALCIHQDTAATLSISTNKTTSDSQMELISPPHLFGESTLDISKVAASAQEVKTEDTTVPDGTMSSREDLTCCDEAKESAESVKQLDEIVMDRELLAEHTDAIANAAEQTSVQTNTAEVGQAMVKELSVKDTDHIAIAEEPASVQNNNLEAVQVNSEKYICSEDSAQVVCSEVSALVASEVSAQAICSEDSAKVLGNVPCHGNLNTKTDMKSKKHVAYSTAHLLFVSKQPLLAALKLHKKRKHKRAKRRPVDNDDFVPDDQQTSTSETFLTEDLSCKSHRRWKRSHASANSDTGDKMNSKKPHLAEQHSSTADLPMDKKEDKDATLASAAPPSSDTGNKMDSKKPHLAEHSSSAADPPVDNKPDKDATLASAALPTSDTGDKMDSEKPHLAEHSGSAADLPVDKKDDKDVTLASAELPSSCVSSVADQTDSGNRARPNERVSRHFDLLTRGLREITVQLWDDIDTPNTKATEFLHARTNSIGYVPDEWDEEYDRGKRKKVRKPKEEEFGGPNPFQEAAEIRSRLRKRFKCDQARWGNQPRRI